MKKVKITVLKTTLDKELAAEYGIEGLTACPMLQAGQVFYADYAKPEGLCDEAWKAIYQYVFALAHGAGEGLFYYGDWIRKPGVAICSCNDGLRPVIFKLEATDEEAVIDYTAVRRPPLPKNSRKKARPGTAAYRAAPRTGRWFVSGGIRSIKCAGDARFFRRGRRMQRRLTAAGAPPASPRRRAAPARVQCGPRPQTPASGGARRTPRPA